jgi:hypothetical protein
MQFRRLPGLFSRLARPFQLRTLAESGIARLRRPGIDYRRERVGCRPRCREGQGLLRKPSESAIAMVIYAVRLLGQYIVGRTLCTSPEYTTSPRSRRYSTAGCSRNLSSGRPAADQRWEGSSRPTLKAIWDSLWYDLADFSRLTLNCTSQEDAREIMARLPNLR